MRRLLGSLAAAGLLWAVAACRDAEPTVSEAVMNTPVALEVIRFDRAFDQMAPGELPRLKARFPYLFPEEYPDSLWLAKQRDTLQQHLRAEVARTFPDFGPYQASLELFFKHLKYNFPEVRIPKVIALTSEVDYENRVILADSLLLIGLDNYLGADHEFYAGLNRYIAKELDPAYLVSDVAGTYGRRLLPYPRERSFLAQMVYHGKLLYLKDQLLPLEPDSVKIGYTGQELAWARANEGQIWRYFIEREVLYSTDRELGPRFLDPAPFSKFQLQLDNESPGRIGRYMGWQIVRSYMDRSGASLRELLAMPGEELFRESNYKPPK